MKILWTTIHVSDLDRSIAFYSDLVELQLLTRFQAGELELAFMGYGQEGETQLELIQSHGDVTFGDSISIGSGGIR